MSLWKDCMLSTSKVKYNSYWTHKIAKEGLSPSASCMVVYVKRTGSHTQYCSHLTDVHFTKRIPHSAACLADEWWLGMETVLIFSAQLGCLLKNQVVRQQARGHVARNIAIALRAKFCVSHLSYSGTLFLVFFSYLLFVLIRLWFNWVTQWSSKTTTRACQLHSKINRDCNFPQSSHQLLLQCQGKYFWNNRQEKSPL